MGSLTMNLSRSFDDQTVAHSRLVTTAKLRRGESFVITGPAHQAQGKAKTMCG